MLLWSNIEMKDQTIWGNAKLPPTRSTFRELIMLTMLTCQVAAVNLFGPNYKIIVEVKLPIIWKERKAEAGRVREEKAIRKKIREEKESEERRSGWRKGRKVTESLCFFQSFMAPEGPKVTSLKRRVRSHLARWEMKHCTPLWREAHLQVKTTRTLHALSTTTTAPTTVRYTRLQLHYTTLYYTTPTPATFTSLRWLH